MLLPGGYMASKTGQTLKKNSHVTCYIKGHNYQKNAFIWSLYHIKMKVNVSPDDTYKLNV